MRNRTKSAAFDRRRREGEEKKGRGGGRGQDASKVKSHMFDETETGREST